MLLRSRWAHRADHHASRAAARRRSARGQRGADGGSDRRDHPQERGLMDVVMPQLGETVKEGTVTAWRKKVGERVEKDEPLFEVNTDKVDMDVPSPAAGVLSAILVPEGTTVRVGEKLAVVDEPGKAAAAAPASEAEARLSPVVRKLLAEHRLDPAAILGTGAGGRITRDDVLPHVAQSAGGQQRKVVPFNRIRNVTAQRRALAWRAI